MQNALIRKKLEEQTENFRKRQEQQQSGLIAPNAVCPSATGIQSVLSNQPSSSTTSTLPNMVPVSTALSSNNSANTVSPVRQHQQHIASPTPTLAFTPTSVLRKMTAGVDKDSVTDASQTSGSVSNNNISNNFNNHNLKMQIQSQQQPQSSQQQLRGYQTITNKWNPFIQAHQQSQSSSKPQGIY